MGVDRREHRIHECAFVRCELGAPDLEEQDHARLAAPLQDGRVEPAAAAFDNDASLTGLGVTKSAYSIHANLIYSPLPKIDLGAELIYGEREIESGLDGDIRRLHLHVKYNF